MNRLLLGLASMCLLTVSCDRFGDNGGKITELNVVKDVASPVWTPDNEILTDTVKPQKQESLQADTEEDLSPEITSEAMEPAPMPQTAPVVPVEAFNFEPAADQKKEEKVQPEQKSSDQIDPAVLQETASSD